MLLCNVSKLSNLNLENELSLDLLEYSLKLYRENNNPNYGLSRRASPKEIEGLEGFI